jgi:hypothetical protein
LGSAQRDQRRARGKAARWAGRGGGCTLGEKRNGPRAELGRNRDELIFHFLFLFLIFQCHFSKNFQIQFEFDLNHSTQNFKCRSMNAQSYFYPHI